MGGESVLAPLSPCQRRHGAVGEATSFLDDVDGSYQVNRQTKKGFVLQSKISLLKTIISGCRMRFCTEKKKRNNTGV